MENILIESEKVVGGWSKLRNGKPHSSYTFNRLSKNNQTKEEN
jgi:hypothetical protein